MTPQGRLLRSRRAGQRRRQTRRARGIDGQAGVFDVIATLYREAVVLAQADARRAGHVHPEIDNWSTAEGLLESTPWTDGSSRRVRVAITESAIDEIGHVDARR